MITRKKLLVIGFVAMMSIMSISITHADLPDGGWWTAQQIQAISRDDTLVTFTAYGQAAEEYTCGGITLDKGEAFVYVPTDEWGITPHCNDFPDGFQGAAVASASGEIVGIVEETNQYVSPLGTMGGKADASYRAMSINETDTLLRFPVYKSEHAEETSTFYIQNAGTAPTRLRATFQECVAGPLTRGCNGTGAIYYYTLTTPVEPGRMVIITPGDAPGMLAGDGYFGSLTVESLDAQPLAGVVNEHSIPAGTGSVGPALYLKSTRAFVPADYDRLLYAPVIKHTYPLESDELTKWSALQIQNVGAITGNFTITYKVAINQADSDRNGSEFVDNTTCTNVAPGQTCFVMTLLPVEGSGTADLLAGEYVAATVEGDVDMVAVVNEETVYNFPQEALYQKAMYSTIPDKAKTNRVGVPTYKEEWIGRIMGVTVQNVGPITTTVTATIQNVNVETWSGAIPPTADLHIQKQDLGPGAATTFLLLSRNQAQLYLGVEVVSGDPAEFVRTNNSMTVESSQPLAVIVNQENTYLPENQPPVLLDAASYEGIPLESD